MIITINLVQIIEIVILLILIGYTIGFLIGQMEERK